MSKWPDNLQRRHSCPSSAETDRSPRVGFGNYVTSTILSTVSRKCVAEPEILYFVRLLMGARGVKYAHLCVVISIMIPMMISWLKRKCKETEKKVCGINIFSTAVMMAGLIRYRLPIDPSSDPAEEIQSVYPDSVIHKST